MSKTNLVVADGCAVRIHYTLTGKDGKEIDSSKGGEPLAYLHGAGNIVPGLERVLTGKRVGEQMKVVVAPADGYGELDPEGISTESKDAFPEEVEVGMQFAAEDGSGEVVPIWIKAIEGDVITIDRNHPLAGQELHFDVKIEAVRRATEDEMDHGHIHGPGGHHH